jgi:hypothetical protein
MGYLEANPSFKLTYSRGGTSGLDGFADSDWGNSVSRRSTTGLMTRFNETFVLWRSKMQKTIALSTAEVEYAASEIAIEVIYLQNLLKNMGLPQAPDTPVYEDNTACIKWGNHVIGHGRERAKHIDLQKHFAHETIQNSIMRLIKIDTSKQLLDTFTKPLAYAQFIGCVRGILGDPNAICHTNAI